MASKDTKQKWWHEGIRFECQGSGQCCVSRDGYGYVYMTKQDRIRMAQSLNMSTTAFTKKFCEKEDGLYHLIDGEEGRCLFLNGKSCGVYQGRPTQCRTWPFWPEVMNATVWEKEVAQFCPGVGTGRLWKKSDIEEQLQIQEESEESI